VKNMQELKQKLIVVLEQTNFTEVIEDIKNFVEDDTMLEFIEKQGKEYILKKMEEWKE
jgi:hypothetical protein